MSHATNLYFLPSGTVDEFNVVIEIPKGSQNKYELDPKTGALFLDRVLYSADFYPFAYGFIPSTKVPDGDALDVAVLLTNQVPPMTVVKARALGVLRKIDSGDQDNCIIAVPVDDARFADYTDLNSVPKHLLKEMEDFFKTYKRLQKKDYVEGVTVKIEGFFGKEEAEKEIADCLNNFPNIDTKVNF